MLTKSFHAITIVSIVMVGCISGYQYDAWGQTPIRIMPPIAAGPLYPADTDTLFRVVKDLLENADTPPRSERLLATIVPHGGYGLSGEVAAHAFKHIRQGEFDRVIILGAAHFSTFEGCSIPAIYGYETPLGIIPVDTAAVEQLTRSPLISARSVREGNSGSRPKLHEIEYSIEMVLPFLQMTLHEFSVIPILVGDLRDASLQYNENIIEAAAEGISRAIDDRTLLVVSTDFTHFGNDFSYRPYSTHILDRIFILDHDIIDHVMALNTNGLQQVVEHNKVPICGLSALQVLTKLLPPNVRGELLAYDTSGRKTNQAERSSVSYAAINFYEIPLHTLEQEPQATVTLRLNPDGEHVEGITPQRRESTTLSLPRGYRRDNANATMEPQMESETTTSDTLPPMPEEANAYEQN